MILLTFVVTPFPYPEDVARSIQLLEINSQDDVIQLTIGRLMEINCVPGLSVPSDRRLQDRVGKNLWNCGAGRHGQMAHLSCDGPKHGSRSTGLFGSV